MFLHWYVHQHPDLLWHMRDDSPKHVTRLVQSLWAFMERKFETDFMRGTTIFRMVSDLRARMCKLLGSPCLLVTMPEPEVAPLAFEIACVLTKRERTIHGVESRTRVFTLESILEDKVPGTMVRRPADREEMLAAMLTDAEVSRKQAFLGEWTVDGRHRNLGSVSPISTTRFLDAVAKHL